MLACCSLVLAQQDDPILMTINGKNIHRSEFEYSYNKNNAEGVIDKKSVDEYVDLFINYQLKVIAAEEARLDTLSSFKKALVVEYPGITDSDGNITITLLYDIEKVISVTDFGGKKIYEEGTDWFVLDGKLIIPKNSSMPRVPWSVYNPQEAPNDGLNAHFSEGGYILYTEGTLLVDRQIALFNDGDVA